VRLKFQLGLNDSQVARSAGIGQATVQDYLRRIAVTGLMPDRVGGGRWPRNERDYADGGHKRDSGLAFAGTFHDHRCAELASQ
jgi:hypothetical protein